MPTIVVPATATPGQLIDVSGANFKPGKFDIATVDANNFESGRATSTQEQERIRRDGTFAVGVLVPTALGTAKIRVYQGGVVVAEAPVLIALVVPPVVPPPPATAPTMYRPIYGSGIQADSKDNRTIGRASRDVLGHRLRERGNSPVVGIAVNWRADADYSNPGLGYSHGTGGTIKIEKFVCGADGYPTGAPLGAAITYVPGPHTTGWEDRGRMAVPSWPTVDGRLVCYVFTNIDPDPTNNWVSINETTVLDGPAAQPAFAPDFAVLVKSGTGGWQVYGNTQVSDVTYADGTHDGNAYPQITVTETASSQVIFSGSTFIRERFTPKADVTVKSMAFRVKRLMGSSPMTMTLSGGAVSVSQGADTSFIPISGEPTPASGNHWNEASLSGGRWVIAQMASPVTLRAGVEYTLRGSCPSDTRLMAIPLREAVHETVPVWGSRKFGDGLAEKSTDGGATWSPAYEFDPHDWQFYMDIST